MAAGDDDWAVLGVSPGSPLDVARAAYLRRAHLLHPDHHPDATPRQSARLGAAMAALNIAWDRIEAEAATPSPPAMTDGGRRPGHVPVPEPHNGSPASSPGGSWPDGFARTLTFQRADRLSLRLWTDDLEPLHVLGHHPGAAVVVALDLHGRPVGDRHLPLLLNLTVLEMLDLSDTEVTDAGLPSLAMLPRLRHLALANTPITDRGLEVIAGCGGITSLNLCDTAVTDEGLTALASLSLATLNLRGTRIDGRILDTLATWPALRLLAIPHLERSARHRFRQERPDVTLV